MGGGLPFGVSINIPSALLIFKELFTFGVKKPTITFQEEKELDEADLPEVLLCPQPGFSSANLRRHGYEKTYSYYRGSADGDKFIGWNGVNKNLSSLQILEDVLILDNQLHGDDTATVSGRELINVSGYTNNNIEFANISVDLRILAFPYGRCLSIHPPTRAIQPPVRLRIEFKEEGIVDQNITSVRLFLLDKTNSLRLYPEDHEMVGLPIKFDFRHEKYSEADYKIQISRTKHVPGDPHLDCRTYTDSDTFNDCFQDDLLDYFKGELGCEPPLLAKDLKKMCDQRFNFTKEKDKDLKERFMHLYYHDGKSKCKTPCVKTIFSSSLIHTFQGLSKTLLFLVFDERIKITQSKFSIDEQTLLIRFKISF